MHRAARPGCCGAAIALSAACAISSVEVDAPPPLRTPENGAATPALLESSGTANAGALTVKRAGEEGACRLDLSEVGAIMPPPSREIEKGARELARGLELAAGGDHTSALAAYGRAIEADPFLGLAYLEKAESHLVTDNDRRAIGVLLSRALLLLPNNPRAHLRYADLCAESGEGRTAEAHWRRALDLRPDLVDARRRLGHHLLESGRPGEAERELLLALDAVPKDIEALTLLGDVLESLRRPIEAARTIERAARIVGRSAALYRRAASLYETGGDVSSARRAYVAANRIDPPPRPRALRPLPESRRRGQKAKPHP